MGEAAPSLTAQGIVADLELVVGGNQEPRFSSSMSPHRSPAACNISPPQPRVRGVRGQSLLGGFLLAPDPTQQDLVGGSRQIHVGGERCLG